VRSAFGIDKMTLFDYLVGAGEDRLRDLNSERLDAAGVNAERAGNHPPHSIHSSSARPRRLGGPPNAADVFD
jgi:hypothetical protein